MQTIAIRDILKCMTSEKNYFGDIWERCPNENKKRYTRSKFKEVLKKMEELGFIRKYGYKNEAYYERMYHNTLEDNIGFINNMIFTYESKINKALKNVENKKIFLDISKDLTAHKFSKHTKTDYELLLEGMLGMFNLASSILLSKEETGDNELKKELKKCFEQISEFMNTVNQKLLSERKTTERIVLQRDFSNRIPKAGYLKF